MTYLVGERAPDEYAKIYAHSYGDKKKKEFTAKIESAEDGSYFLNKRVGPGGRYTIKYGDDMITVTHVKRDGEWEEYAKGETTNLVIRVRTGDSTWAVHEIIERRLRNTKLGRAVGYEPLREMSRSILEMLGLDDYDSWRASETYASLETEDNARARNALKALLEFAPEGGYHEDLGKIGAEVDGVGYAENADKYNEVINGVSNGFDEPYEKSKEPLPMLSEPVYYAVAGGKHNGRSFKALLNELKAAIGYEDEED